MNFTILLSTGDVHSLSDFKGTVEVIANEALGIKNENGLCVAIYPKGVWLYFIQDDKVKTSRE